MKIILFLTTFLFLFIPGIILADPSEIGLKAGLNANTIGGANVSVLHQLELTGYSLGGFADIGLLDFLSFQPEVSFILKGDYGYGRPEAGDDLFDDRYYLEFPLLLKAKFLTLGDLKINGLAGPYFAFLLRSENTIDALMSNSPLFNGTDEGVVLGVSLDLENFVLDGRWEGGLTSFYNGIFAGTAAQNVRNVTNETFMISLGYQFFQL